MTTDDRLLSGASSLHPNKSSGDIVERLKDIAGLSERQVELYDQLAKLNRGDHWLFFTNAGFTMEDARVLHEKGLINATRQMGIPAAQLKRNEQTISEKLLALHATALDELDLPPEADTVHKQAAAEIERLRRERDEARTIVVEANNSLYGSQGYFHSTNGGPFDKYHLARPIEELKSRARDALTAESAVAAAWEEAVKIAEDNAQHSNTASQRDDFERFAELGYEQACEDIASAIRAAGSKKTAESGHSPSTREG